MSTIRRALLLAALCAASAATAGAQEIKPYVAQEIKPYHGPSAAQATGAEAEIEGVYQLDSFNGDALPFRTPSFYGTIRSGTLTLRRGKYTLLYIHGNNQRLRISGSYAYNPEEGEVSFHPTTPSGVAESSAEFEEGVMTFNVPVAFGINNAELVFQYSGPVPAPGARGGGYGGRAAPTPRQPQAYPPAPQYPPMPQYPAPDTEAGVSRGGEPQVELAAFFGNWQLVVEGAAYTTDNYATNTRTTTSSAGAMGRRLTVAGDGSYTWGDQVGQWRSTGEDPVAGWPIVLLGADGGGDWKVGWDTRRQGRRGNILIWDGYTYQVGSRLR